MQCYRISPMTGYFPYFFFFLLDYKLYQEALGVCWGWVAGWSLFFFFLDGLSWLKSTACTGKCFVTLGSASLWHQWQKHLHTLWMPLGMIGATPIQKPLEAVGKRSYSHLFPQWLAHSRQPVNAYWTDIWMTVCLNSEYRKKVFHFPNTYSCSLKKLCLEFALYVRQGTKYLECTVTKQRWSLSGGS